MLHCLTLPALGRCCNLTVDDVMFPGDVAVWQLMMWCSREMLQPDGWWMKGYQGTYILRPDSWWWDIREWRCYGCLDRQIPLSGMLLISSLNALVRSAGFSLKTQPRLLLLPISFHGLTTATVSSWVQLILSSNLSRKFRTLLQDLFSWHPVATTQHLSWKNCTGFPFQNVLSIKSLLCVSVL